MALNSSVEEECQPFESSASIKLCVHLSSPVNLVHFHSTSVMCVCRCFEVAFVWFPFQEWVSMNCWISLKEIAESTMMMSLLWLYRLKEEFGSHQESIRETYYWSDLHSYPIERAVPIFNWSYSQVVSEVSQMTHFSWVSFVFYVAQHEDYRLQLIEEILLVMAKG